MRIAALSIGVGNVRSVLRALEHAVAALPAPSSPRSTEIIATSVPEDVRAADVLVVPGQGSFGAFAAAMNRDLREVLLERIAAGTPYLGICLGLQILFEDSDEAPDAHGLGVLGGRVRRLAPGGGPGRSAGGDNGRHGQDERGVTLPLPHMGWNRVVPVGTGSLIAPAHYYFAHTYAAAPTDERVTLATTEYGETFASAVRRDNVVGVQFHPEKSQAKGLDVLERFFSGVASEG